MPGTSVTRRSSACASTSARARSCASVRRWAQARRLGMTPEVGTRRDENFRTVLAPLGLLVVCPPLVLIVWTIVVRLDGSIARAFTAAGLDEIRRALPRPSLGAFAQVSVFGAVQLALLRGLPGTTFSGPVT